MAARVDHTDAMENYVKAIYALQRRGEDKPVSTTALAERMHVTPASVSGLVKKLADRGLVRHVPYKGVELSVGIGCTTRPRCSSTSSRRSWRS